MTRARLHRISAPALLVVLALAAGSPAAGADKPKDAPDDAAVRALIGRWLDAQNKGDFAAYRALYAPSFHGIRRSGGRTVVLDHPGWLRDRERMFKKPMKVAATDVRVERDGVFARARFVQEFSSGNYADRGRKQVDVAVIGGVPVIAREELLESERLPAGAKPGALPVDSKAAEAAAPRDDADCPPAKAAPFTGTFRGEPGWFVLGETSSDAKAIMASALKLEAASVEAHPLATASFGGLAPDLYAVVFGAFDTRAEAQALVDRLRQLKIKAFAKESGPLRGGRLVEIRGIATRNGKPGRWPVLISDETGGEGDITAAANGQFVFWMDMTGKLEIENAAPTPNEHDMRAPAKVCINLPASARGRIDVGTLDTTTWFCGR
jgi:ketosteroid isomerase-like protein